jgi:glycosyltransferase involved in cell wall biosynthesis
MSFAREDGVRTVGDLASPAKSSAGNDKHGRNGPSASAPTTQLSAEERQRRGKLLAAANAARDARQWAEAAEGYQAFLALDPDAAPIWVQCGHMLKEAGRRSEAQTAYERALKLEPQNADTHLQMGHLFKITSRKISAMQMYSRALEIDPELREAERELRALGADARADGILEKSSSRRSAAEERFYFDISDLVFHHFPSNRSPTGIQRIVLAVAEAALEGGQAKDVGLCVLEGDTGKWKSVDKEAALHLMMLSHEGAGNSDLAWKSALGDVHRALAAARPFVFPKGSTVVSLGAPWGIRRYFAAVRAAKRESGIRSVGYIHDTVPLLYPEYCDGVVPEEFLRWLRRLSRHADLVLANSHSTKRDFIQALAMVRARSVPCEVVYPNGDFSSLFQNSEEISPEVEALAGTEYALFVGTVQPRKNHLMVLSGWRHLIKELGARNVPNLVLAGKLGWYWEQLVEFIRKTDHLDGKLTMLNKASDADLQTLYRNAKFTIYNSHYEGWGLPVTESLAFGKVPVISRNSALLESGGKYAVFYETNSEPSFVETIRGLLANPDILKAREEAIRNDPPVRPWNEVFTETRAVVERSLAMHEAEPIGPEASISMRKVYRFGQVRNHASENDLADWEAMEDLMAVGSQWWDVEEWGVWTRSKKVEMTFAAPELVGTSGDNLMLFLHVRGHRQHAQITLELNGVTSEPIVVAPSPPPPAAAMETVIRVNLTGEMIRQGRIVLNIEQNVLTDLDKLTDGADRRKIGIGLRSLLICAEHDVASRLNFLEAVAGYTPSIVAAMQPAEGRTHVTPAGLENDEEGAFLRLGGERADIAHAPDRLVQAGKL